MSAKIYYEKDADLTKISDKRICVLGYGSQGRAHANNLNDSGLNVVVGLREGSGSFARAEADGVEAMEAKKACADADIVCFLLPDAAQPEAYYSYMEPSIRSGQTLLFAHGFNIHFGQIIAPKDVDVIMVAPKGPGNLVRELYQAGQGIPCLVAVDQDATGDALANGLAYSLGIGGARAGVVETTFKEETETDLFGEQAVLCGGSVALMKAGFDTLVEAGYAPEMAYFECIHEMKLIVDLVYKGGFGFMRNFISETAKYGDMTRGPRIITEETRDEMRQILHEIQSGEFAREWVLENQANRPVYHALLRMEAEHHSEGVGGKLREMMPWL